MVEAESPRDFLSVSFIGGILDIFPFEKGDHELVGEGEKKLAGRPHIVTEDKFESQQIAPEANGFFYVGCRKSGMMCPLNIEWVVVF